MSAHHPDCGKPSVPLLYESPLICAQLTTLKFETVKLFADILQSFQPAELMQATTPLYSTAPACRAAADSGSGAACERHSITSQQADMRVMMVVVYKIRFWNTFFAFARAIDTDQLVAGMLPKVGRGAVDPHTAKAQIWQRCPDRYALTARYRVASSVVLRRCRRFQGQSVIILVTVTSFTSTCHVIGPGGNPYSPCYNQGE